MNSDPLLSSRERLAFQHSLASVIWHDDGYVRIDWHTVPMVSAEVRALFWQILILLEHAQVTKLLTDHSTMPPLWPDDCKWLLLQWAPQAALQAGCTHVAVVETKEFLCQRPTYASTALLNVLPVHVCYFDSMTTAEQWLCTS